MVYVRPGHPCDGATAEPDINVYYKGYAGVEEGRNGGAFRIFKLPDGTPCTDEPAPPIVSGQGGNFDGGGAAHKFEATGAAVDALGLALIVALLLAQIRKAKPSPGQ